ncbi:MAG: efflux RND transporter periplasmic adaptor subunit [Rhizobium sp.]|nr:efflux RND transporter periplasmic adaptor subunit [Rhizobium sp.]
MNRLTIAGLLMATLALSACQEDNSQDAPPIRPVLSMVVRPTPADATRFTGNVESRYTSELGFEIAGRLTHRPVNVGDLVLAGQRLAEIDPLAYRLQARIADAELESAIAQQANAVTNEAREKTLLDQNISSQASFDSVRQARQSADASVASAKAKVAKSREQLANTVITSTFAGVVTAVSAEPGQTIQAGQTVVTLARPDVREAVVDVPDRIGRTLKVNAAFRVASQAHPSLTAMGHVREIAPSLDAATRTTRVRISLDNPPSGFRLGTVVTASISTPEVQALLIPPSAVFKRDGRTLVWIVANNGTVSTREVGLEPHGTLLRVTGGLSEGDRLVTAGVNSLAEGQQVKISDEVAQ